MIEMEKRQEQKRNEALQREVTAKSVLHLQTQEIENQEATNLVQLVLAGRGKNANSMIPVKTITEEERKKEQKEEAGKQVLKMEREMREEKRKQELLRHASETVSAKKIVETSATATPQIMKEIFVSSTAKLESTPTKDPFEVRKLKPASPEANEDSTARKSSMKALVVDSKAATELETPKVSTKRKVDSTAQVSHGSIKRRVDTASNTGSGGWRTIVSSLVGGIA
jgi:hypothetical protein